VIADVVICGLHQVDTVLMDDGVGPRLRDELERSGLKCIVV